MSSAFKNFFITFAVCLLVFGFIGFKYAYPWLTDMVDFSEMGKNTSGETSEDTSGETSDETSEEISAPIVPDDEYDENGDVFTAVIMAVDSNGRAVNTVFIDANGKTKHYIYCPIPGTVKGTNEAGVTVPVSELFCAMTPDAICKSVTAMTGIETKYCLKFRRENLSAIASLIPGAYVVLNENVSFVNPKYEDFEPKEGEVYPDDYYITITNVDGKVLLNETINGKTKLEWLLAYTPDEDGDEFNTLYSKISQALIRQFFNSESSTKSTDVLSKVIRNCETNLSVDKASSHLATIFSYDDYQRYELTYPSNWEGAVAKLRDLDGTYNRQ